MKQCSSIAGGHAVDGSVSGNTIAVIWPVNSFGNGFASGGGGVR